MPLLIDCTNAIGVPLMYDRSDAGYGVPVEGVRFKGTQKLYDALEGVGRDLKQIGWWEYIESVLTAGLYVKKPGGHGDGTDIDIDGVVLKPNPLEPDQTIRILTYKSADTDFYWNESMKAWFHRGFLPDRIKTRLACLFSLRFPIVLTAGYNAAHEDHIHMSIAGEVGWRGSRSQVVLVQETLNAWFDAGLVVDSILGDLTTYMWFHEYGMDKPNTERWLAWLKMIAFDPPKDGA